MSGTELATVDMTTGEVIVPRETPAAILAHARQQALALQDVIAGKAKPLMIGGKQYLEYDDWQTVGRFCGVTARAVSVEPVNVAGVVGFKASAVAVRNGEQISGADAYCLTDEDKWRDRPLFQLASMAQTRACAKSLRNVLAWIVVLAGYQGTPAEEMDETAGAAAPRPARTSTPRPPSNAPVVGRDTRLISPKQEQRFHAIARDRGWTEPQLATLLQRHGCTAAGQLSRLEYDAACALLEAGPAVLDAPGTTQPPPF